MNRDRRRRIDAVIKQLESMRKEVASIIADEQDAHDHLPEGIQISEQGESMQDAISSIADAADSITDAIDYLSDAQEQ